MPDRYDPIAALYEQLSQMEGQISSEELEIAQDLSAPLAHIGGIKAHQQRLREKYGLDPSESDRERILDMTQPFMIERFIEGGNVSEKDAALGMAKLGAIKTYGTGKGRVETYADGSLEWVPEGLPTTGEVFFDPNIEPEGQALSRRQGRHVAEMRQFFGESPGISPAQLDPELMELINISQSAGKEGLQFFEGEPLRKPYGFQEGGLAAVTGVGEPKMKEDEDQPLVPKPGNLISRTLGRIRKFFGFAEGGLVRYAAYAQGGRVGFQNGGLAAVAGNPDDDEDDDGRPRNLVAESLGRLKMTRDEALRSLTTGREALLAQKRDQSAKWLRFAQGMLAPTRTGGFGESVGKTAGLLAEEEEAGREFELDRSQRLREIESEMRDVEQTYAKEELRAAQKQEEAEAVSLRQSIGVPFSAYTLNQKAEKVLAKAIVKLDEDGNEYIHFPRDKQGRKVVVPDRLDPELLRRIAEGKAFGAEGAKMDIEIVNKAFKYKNDYGRALLGLQLLDEIDKAGGTGGIQAIIQKAREFFGDEAQDVTDRGTLMNLIGGHLFKALESFGTQINRKELEIAQSLVGSIARPSGINRQMLQNWAGEIEWHMGYANHVAKQSGNQKLIDKMAVPIPNYGLTEGRLARAQRAGFTVAEYVPWDAQPEEDEPDLTGVGTQGNGIVVEGGSELYEPTYAEVPRGSWFKIQLPDGTITNEYRQN